MSGTNPEDTLWAKNDRKSEAEEKKRILLA